MAYIDRLLLGLMYVKKIQQFLSSIKKMHAKEKSVPFFCLTVYTGLQVLPSTTATADRRLFTLVVQRLSVD